MKIRRVVAAIATGALALTVSGCGSGGGGGGADASGGDAQTLTYWASNQGTSVKHDKEVLTPQLKKFEEQTGISVELEVIGWDSLQTRIQTAITSGQAPDVVNIGNTWAASLQATGSFLPFDDQAMSAIGGADKFVETALATGGAEGQPVTSVPLYGLAYGLFYNKAMFEEAGIQPPSTYMEMVDAAEKLTDQKTGVHGLALAAGSYTENSHFAFINAVQNGAELFDDQGQPTFSSDGVVKGIHRYLDLMQKHEVAGTSNAQYTNGVQAVNDFAKGKVAMVISQNNAGSSIEAQGMKADEWGVVPYPAPEGAEQIASHVAGINLSIFENTENQEGALKFVKFMTSAETQKAVSAEFKTLPVLKGAEPTFSKKKEASKMFQDIYNNMSAPLPLVPAEDQFESSVGQAMNQMFATIATGGTVTLEDVRVAMETAEQQVAASSGS